MYFHDDHAPFLPKVAVHKSTVLLHIRIMDAKPMDATYGWFFCLDLTLLLDKDQTKMRYKSGCILTMEIIDKK